MNGLTALTIGITFTFSILYLLLALTGKEQSKQTNLLSAMYFLLMCIAIEMWELIRQITLTPLS